MLDEAGRSTKAVRKNPFERSCPDETETFEHRSVTKQKNTVRSASQGAELRKRTRCCRCQQNWTLGDRVSESSNERRSSSTSEMLFFLPGDAFAQLHNLATYMLFNGASASLKRTSRSKHSDFVGLILGLARGLTDNGAQQLVVGTSAAHRWSDRLRKQHKLIPVNMTPSNMTATCGGIGSAKVVQVLDFLDGIVGVNGIMRFLVLEEPVSLD